MPGPVIKYAFVAGVLSPKLFGRTDLEKYDLGLAEATNFFVDFQGGISTRPGTEFVDYTLFNDQATKFVPFRFAPNVANTYVLLFSNQAVHFFQDGAPVVETAILGITNITQASPPVVTRAAHGLSNNDRVIISNVAGMTEINDQEFKVRNVAANTFELWLPIAENVAANSVPWTAYSGPGGQIARIYSISTPYTSSDLEDLRAYQIRDTIRLTHPGYAVRNLTRNGHANWVLAVENFGNGVARPTGTTITASAAGNASVGFEITAVDLDGKESLPGARAIQDLIVNYTTTAGSVTVTWTAVANVKSYNVYRTLVMPESVTGSSTDATVTRADEVGYVGQSFGPRFVDMNIIPDFTRTPPVERDPFAVGAIEQINVTNGGAGYANGDTVNASVGTGFSGYPIVDPGGVIIAVVVVRGGTGYTGTAITFTSGGGGAGATATAVVGPTTGTYPSISAVVQQRQVYAASLNDPLTLWFSRPGYFSNFDESQVASDADSIELEIDSEEVAPFLHLVEVSSGVLALSQTGIWLLRGLDNGSAITQSNALADPQNYRGCSAVPPIKIDSDLLYVEGKGTTVRLLTNYSDLTKKYAGQDVSILSNHFFSVPNKIEAWSYASNPHNLIWAVRTDGKFLPFTLVKEQDVYAWSLCETQGIVTDCLTIQEGGYDYTYLAVKRRVGGRWNKYIERIAQRTFSHVEDAWCVDFGLSLPATTLSAILYPGAASGTGVNFFADAAVFLVGMVGWVIRVGGGKATITAFVNAQNVTVTINRPITNVNPETSLPFPARSGAWTCDQPRTSVGGLWHLEGETVNVVCDGEQIPDKTVSQGRVTFGGREVTRATVGMGFTCRARTLPPTTDQGIIEHRKKRPILLAVRVNDTVGLKVGAELNNLQPMDDVASTLVGEPTPLQNGQQFKVIEAAFDENGQTYMVQDNALPASIIGIVTNLEVGDDDQ